MPRRLLVVLALMVVGLLGVGVTAAVKRQADDKAKVASPRASASSEPEPEPTFAEPTETAPTDTPSPIDSPAAVPSTDASPSAAPGSGQGSGPGSPQALGPGAPSTPETGPVTAVLFIGAISAISAIVVHRRFFR